MNSEEAERKFVPAQRKKVETEKKKDRKNKESYFHVSDSDVVLALVWPAFVLTENR